MIGQGQVIPALDIQRQALGPGARDVGRPRARGDGHPPRAEPGAIVQGGGDAGVVRVHADDTLLAPFAAEGAQPRGHSGDQRLGITDVAGAGEPQTGGGAQAQIRLQRRDIVGPDLLHLDPQMAPQGGARPCAARARLGRPDVEHIVAHHQVARPAFIQKGVQPGIRLREQPGQMTGDVPDPVGPAVCQKFQHPARVGHRVAVINT